MSIVPDVHIVPYRTMFDQAAADAIVASIRSAIARRGSCVLVLSGGATPRTVYRRIAAANEKIPWDRVHLLFADERMVPPTDMRSNYGMIREALISHIAIPAENVHPICGELPAEESARVYEAHVRTFVDHSEPCDVAVLGVGEDGHTASLFPGSEAVLERSAWASPVYVPRLDSWRVTLTFPLLNTAHDVFFLVAGSQKATIMRQLMIGSPHTVTAPAALIQPAQGEVHWILDAEAAALLKPA